ARLSAANQSCHVMTPNAIKHPVRGRGTPLLKEKMLAISIAGRRSCPHSVPSLEPRPRSPQNSQPHRDGNRMGAVAGVELGQDKPQMVADGVAADLERGGDFVRREAVGK